MPTEQEFIDLQRKYNKLQDQHEFLKARKNSKPRSESREREKNSLTK